MVVQILSEDYVLRYVENVLWISSLFLDDGTCKKCP